MVVRKRGREAHERRGTHTHGWGHKKKHRGSGNRGGRGNAGRFKHNKIKAIVEGWFIDKNKGFKQKGIIPVIEPINIIQLEEMADSLVQQKLAKVEGGKIHINLAAIKKDKLLGTGKPKRAFVVTAKQFSEGAKKKIEAAGGQAIAAAGGQAKAA